MTEGRPVKYVSVGTHDHGIIVNPDRYLEWLEDSAHLLPPGARAWATTEGHYEQFHTHCVKNPKVVSFVAGSRRDGGADLEVRMDGNQFLHEVGATLRYYGVESVEILRTTLDDDFAEADPFPGEILLDEVLPHDSGVQHEIACIGGIVRVIAADLEMEWDDEADEL